MEYQHHKLIILGSGPAGYAAGIYAQLGREGTFWWEMMHGLRKFHERIGCSTPDRQCHHEGVRMQTIFSKMRSSACQASIYRVCGLRSCRDGALNWPMKGARP